MDNTYKIMFAVGLLYTLVSFVISSISGALHIGSHLGDMHSHFGGDGHIQGNFDGHGHIHGDPGGHAGDVSSHHIDPGNHGSVIGDTILSWFSILINPIVIVSFLTVFGGIGIMGTDYFKWAALKVFLVALSSGIITAFLLYKFIAIPLYRSENSTDVSRDDLVSTPAEVISPILENGFGEIKYIANSLRYTAPARHIDGKAVKQGKKVVICKIENNIFYVTEMEEL